MAEETVPFGTRLRPDIRKRLRLTAALSGQRIWRVLNALLDERLPSVEDLLRGQIPEGGATP